MRVALLALLPATAFAFTPSLSSNGAPLHWASSTVTMALDDDAVAPTLAAACEAWSALPEARFELSPGAGNNRVHFEHEAWRYGADRLAVTVLEVEPDSGVILSAKIEVNEVDYRFSTSDEPPHDTVFDLGAVLTHELGHVLGLAHSGELEATMYASTAPRDLHQRVPNADDRAGIAYLYDQVWPQRGNGATESMQMPALTGGCSYSGAPTGGLWVALLALTWIWRQRQTNRRRSVIALTNAGVKNREVRAPKGLR